MHKMPVAAFVLLSAIAGISISSNPAQARDRNWGTYSGAANRTYAPGYFTSGPGYSSYGYAGAPYDDQFINRQQFGAPFDGNWSATAQTTRGHCEDIQFGLDINGGRISSGGGSYGGYGAEMGGRVSRSGRVRVSAVAGPRVAHGTGRLGLDQGSGTWSGRGPSGVCSGVWTASRSMF